MQLRLGSRALARGIWFLTLRLGFGASEDVLDAIGGCCYRHSFGIVSSSLFFVFLFSFFIRSWILLLGYCKRSCMRCMVMSFWSRAFSCLLSRLPSFSLRGLLGSIISTEFIDLHFSRTRVAFETASVLKLHYSSAFWKLFNCFAHLTRKYDKKDFPFECPVCNVLVYASCSCKS